MQLSRMDFIRNHPVAQRARVTFRGRAGHEYQQLLDNKGLDYYLTKKMETWFVVYEFVVAVTPESLVQESEVIEGIQESWTTEEILAREG